MSAEELLDECERFLRDFAHAARDLGAPRCVYVPAAGRDPSTSGLQPSQLGPALRLFDGQRTLTDVIEDSPFRVFDTLRVIKRLLDAGALAVKSDGGSDGEPLSMLEHWAVIPEQRGIVGERRRTSRRLKTVGGPAPAQAAPAIPAIQPSAAVSNAAVASPFAPLQTTSLRSSTPTPVGPIPLTHKKHPTGNTTTVGEISARKQAPTPAAMEALAQAPTVQFKLEDLSPAAPMVPTGAAPVTARQAPSAAPPEPRAMTPAPRDNLRRTPPPDHLRRTPPPEGSRLRDSGKRPSLDALLSSGPDSKNKLRKILPQRMTPSTAFDAVEADFFAREADLYKQEDVESFDDLDRSGTRRPGAPKRR
jgi:hypothetical protein